MSVSKSKCGRICYYIIYGKDSLALLALIFIQFIHVSGVNSLIVSSFYM